MVLSLYRILAITITGFFIVLFTVVTAQSGRVVSTKFRFPTGINVLDFGAKCDGVTDDSLALQNAINSADTAPYTTLQLPAATCTFQTPLVIGDHLSRYCMINIIGESEYASILNYTGSMSQAALSIRHCSAFQWSGFSIQSGQYANFSTHGTSVGILLDKATAQSGGGTFNTSITFNHITVNGFHIGIMAGGDASASEIDCYQCGLNYNDIGWQSFTFNSLNFWFYGVHLGHNQIGMQMGGDGVHIFGGDSSGNLVADFYFQGGFGTFSVDSFRAEITASGAKFMTAFSQSSYPTVVSVKNSSIIGQYDIIVADLGGRTVTLDGMYVVGLLSLFPGASNPCQPIETSPTSFKSLIYIHDSMLTFAGPDILLNFPPGLFKFRFERVSDSRPNFSWLTDQSGFWNCTALQ